VNSDQHIISRLAIIAVVSACCGCGGGVGAETRQSVQISFNEGEKAYLEKDYATAEAKLAASMTGGLQPDLLARAYLYRAISLGKLGRKDEALADLEMAGRGEVSDKDLKKARAEIEGKDKGRSTASVR